jgi:hypothetical protein
MEPPGIKKSITGSTEKTYLAQNKCLMHIRDITLHLLLKKGFNHKIAE